MAQRKKKNVALKDAAVLLSAFAVIHRGLSGVRHGVILRHDIVHHYEYEEIGMNPRHVNIHVPPDGRPDFAPAA